MSEPRRSVEEIASDILNLHYPNGAEEHPATKHSIKQAILSERSKVAAIEKELKSSESRFVRLKKELWAMHEAEVKALEQKLLASEVRGGEMAKVLTETDRVLNLLPNRPVLGSEAEALIFASMHNGVRKALSKLPSYYLSQVEAIGKMVEALRKLIKPTPAERRGWNDEDLMNGALDECADALATWNSIKGETEQA